MHDHGYNRVCKAFANVTAFSSCRIAFLIFIGSARDSARTRRRNEEGGAELRTLLRSIAWVLDDDDDDDDDANLWRESGEGSPRLISDDNFSLEEELGLDLDSVSDFMEEEGGIDGDGVEESAPELESMQNGGSGEEDSMERRRGRENREIEFRDTLLRNVLWVLDDDNDEDSWSESGEVNPRLVSDDNLCFREEELGLHLNSDSDFLSENEEGEGDGGEVEESVSELESMQEAEPREDSCRCEDHFLCECPRRRIIGFETDSYSCSDIGHVLSDEATDVELEDEESVAGMESIQEDESAEDSCIYEDHFLCECPRRHIVGFETDSFSVSESVVSDEEADSELVCIGTEESVSESQSLADEAADWEQEDVDGSMVGSDAEESVSEFEWMQRGDLAGENCTYEDHFLCECPMRQIIGFDSDSNCESEVEPTMSDEEEDSEQAEIDARLDEWGDVISTIFNTDMEESELGSESPQREEPANVDLPDQNIVRLFDDSASELESTRGEEDLDSAYLSLLALELRRLTFALRSDDDVPISGSRRAACKLVVERLPSVLLVAEDRGEADDDMLCVVCDDEISLGEWATLLPCSHYYHGECILPWLKIRNTCPMCRYELPTDADYANDYFDLFSSV
ncbi:uncharacterized protein LOC109720354 [Ananas comosus]|uniref:Uncharacterized protein LOC109720354 n=1 Tax=Ananas comosus TaxID=4615 RepID=A0A6P5G320_ANACO|nr:uncharacterized protein LOC109720354 [Ananas comosus]